MSQTVQTAAPAIGCDGGLQQHAETIRRLELEGDGERTKSSASWFVRSLVFVVGCDRDLQQDARVQTLVMTLRVSCETVLQGGCLTGGLSCKRVVLQGGCLARGLSCKRVVLQGGCLAKRLSCKGAVLQGKASHWSQIACQIPKNAPHKCCAAWLSSL